MALGIKVEIDEKEMWVTSGTSLDYSPNALDAHDFVDQETIDKFIDDNSGDTDFASGNPHGADPETE